MQLGGLEEALLDSVSNRRHFDDTISERLWSLHPAFRRVVFFNGILSPPVQPVNCGVVKIRRAPISSAACQAFCSFICDGRWKWGTKHTQDRTSGVALAVEFVASFGLFPGLCDQEMSVGILVRRFKDVLLQIIQKHHVTADHIVGIRHMKSFGFGNQSGLSCSRQFRHHDKLLAWILRVSKDVSCLDRTVKMKPFASIVPCWDGTTPGS